MYRKSYRKRQARTPELITAPVILIVLFGVYFTSTLSPEKRSYFIAACALIVVALICTAGWFVYERERRRREKLRAFDISGIDTMDGLDFEKYLVELLRARGYSNLELTERFDYGVDIIAVKDGVRWGVQAKRYSNLVKAEAVRQVVTALNKYNCQRSMVITNSTFSRPAQLLAESNNCILVDRTLLMEWVSEYQTPAQIPHVQST